MARSPVSRRDFIKRTAAQAAAAGTAVSALSAGLPSAADSPNARLRIALVGAGARGQAHLDVLLRLAHEGRPIELAGVCDVFGRYREQAADKIARAADRPRVAGDYRELLARPDIDLVLLATPDHWHARMTIDALRAGKHVYCERPMTHTVAEAQEVLSTWRETGRVMQVGVQSASDGRWRAAREFVCQGGIGRLVQGQTECFRNSAMGQWRGAGLARDMTPRNIDWKMFLGSELGLAPAMPFDRAAFAQWRCYWPLGSGLFGELFVPQATRLLAATGLRCPRRVVAGGGIFLEHDGRDVPDTATIVADYDEGVQLLLTASMLNDHKIEHCLRGHHGTILFDMGREGFDVLPQRPQVTRARDDQRRHVPAPRPADETVAHWENFLDAVVLGDPWYCHNTPVLGAAAVTLVGMGVESYRYGEALEWDAAAGRVVESSRQYARQWEALSRERGPARDIAGWNPAEKDPRYSLPRPGSYQKLEGPWPDEDTDPAA